MGTIDGVSVVTGAGTVTAVGDVNGVGTLTTVGAIGDTGTVLSDLEVLSSLTKKYINKAIPTKIKRRPKHSRQL